MARHIDALSDVDGRPLRLAGDGGGAKAALARRLENLPAEHPSSPGYAASDHRADRPKATYWDRIQEFERLWVEHERRWPEPVRADRPRSGDPPGSWRADGGRYLSPEQNAEADREIATMRNREESITETLKRIEQENSYGGVLAGLEHRLKGENRLKEKIADKVQRKVGETVADATDTIWDAVRYTFMLASGDYAGGHDDITGRLKSAGCRLVERENNWRANPEYKGINTRWATPHGGRFELQFHTPDSLDAKENRTHRAYERLRSPDTTRAELRELRAYQRMVSGAVPVPPGVAVIPNYKERT